MKRKTRELFYYVYLGPHARLGCFFVHHFILYSMISRWWHSRLLLSFMFTWLKNKGFSSFQQQFVLMSKIEQLVIRRRNYKKYFNSFFIFFGCQSLGAHTCILVSKSCWIHRWSKTEKAKFFWKIFILRKRSKIPSK